MPIEFEEGKDIYENEIRELVRLVVEKAKKESRGTTKNAWGNFIEDNSNLKSKTFIRMHDRYMLQDKSQSIPGIYSLDAAAEFIGQTGFAGFCNQFFPEEKNENTLAETNFKPKNKFKKTIIGTGTAAIIGFASYFGFNAANQPACMYWNGKDYKTVDCNENLHPKISIIPIDEELISHFHKLEVSDTTQFFEAGKPVVWYRKVDGKVEFYSAPGNHPINGKELKPVTKYIVKKYVLNQ